MQQITNDGLQKFLSPRREISCYIEMNLEDSYEILRAKQIYNWKIERNAEDSKFFGTGVCQKMTLETIMTNFSSPVRTINPVSGVSGFTFSTPLFYITEVIQDEVANKITYTGYDGLYFATQHKIKEANLPSTYTIKELAEKAVALIPELSGVDTSSLNLPFTSANLSGEETCREIFDDIAEATQTNYYVNSENILCFKRMNTIVSVNVPKTAYFEATTGAVYVLKTIMSVTELGDNASSTATGSPDVSGIEVTQYVRENCFYTQLKDTQIKNALQYAINNVGNSYLYEYSIKWRGITATEPFDIISFANKDGVYVEAVLFNDTISYNGGLIEQSSWSYKAQDETEESSGIGERINNTFARVNKVDNTVKIHAGLINNLQEEYAELNVTVDGINTKVQKNSGDISTLNQTATEINTQVQKNTGEISTLNQTATELRSEVTDANNNASQAIQTANGFSQRITNAEGSISSIELTMDGVIYQNDQGTTVINGSNITTGYISANRISGGTIDADTINVNNLNASNLTKGLVSASRISDSNNYLSNLYATNVYTAINYAQTVQLVTSGASGLENSGTVLKPNGVYIKNGGSTTLLATWQQMANGGSSTKTAVFG